MTLKKDVDQGQTVVLFSPSMACYAPLMPSAFKTRNDVGSGFLGGLGNQRPRQDAERPAMASIETNCTRRPPIKLWKGTRIATER